ncbi:MAG: zeta toxin family protein, partial [Alphaproteobacteria bacterium]
FEPLTAEAFPAASHEPIADAAADSSVRTGVADALAGHGVPDPLVRWLAEAAGSLSDLPAELALAAALEDRLQFGGAPFRPSLRPIVLVGPPGAGKTTTAAKLAAQAVVNGAAVDLMAADTVKTGAVEQLAGLARHMQLTVETGDNLAALAAGWRQRRAAHEAAGRPVQAIVDTTGANPYDPEDLARIGALIAGVRGHGVLVLGAGGDPLEQADIACAFAEAGATHLIVTRVDAARRLGGLLTAAAARADGRSLKFCGVGISPRIGNGLRPITPVSLAKLLLDPFEAGSVQDWSSLSQEECA